jgi:1-acyl-sn-glycerol-3-phosphate acyltransferase
LRFPPFHWWRTVFFLIPAITLYTIVLGTLSIASTLFERRGYFPHQCARWWSWLILKTTGVHVDIDGLERLVPGKTYVFVANHQSHYDTPIIFSTLPYQLRIIAKESLGTFPFVGWHLRRTGHMLIDRRKPDPTTIFRWAGELTGRGLSLIVYPEGTRSDDGKVARFKGGSFYLALEAGLPIVPLSVVGTREVMPKGRLAAHPAHVRLIVHEPIDTTHMRGTDAKVFGERVRQIIKPDVEAAALRT